MSGTTNNFQLFGPAHIAILCAVPAFAAVLGLLQRRLPPGTSWLRLGFAALILSDSLLYRGYLVERGLLLFPNHLPIELCDVSQVMVIVVLFTLNNPVFDLTYYWALGGASMALLTPDLWEPCPSFGGVQFFIDHGLTVAGTLFLVWSGLARPRAWSVAKAMLGVNIFAAVIGTFDFVFGTNYMYLRAKPASTSLLDAMGPWPWYIAWGEIVALLIFTLLYLPVRRSARKATELEEGKHFV